MNEEEMETMADKIHRIWYHFSDYMSEWYFELEDEWEVDDDDNIVRTGTQSKTFASQKMIGYDAMVRVDKYCNKYNDVDYLLVDDAGHSTSYLVFIPHPEMGITIIFIPQVATVNTNHFFLYPQNIVGIQKVLDVMSVKYSCLDE